CLALLGMTPELQRQNEKIETLSAILLHLQEMYGAESRTQRFNLLRKLFKAQMQEGASVHEHGLKMIDIIEQMAQLEFVTDHDLYVDLILTSLPKSDSSSCKGKSVLMPVNTKGKGNKKQKNKKGKLRASGNVSKDRMKKLAAEGACFQCSKTGHWKKVCHVAVAAVSTDNPHGASTSGMFMIELNLALNSSSSWVLDTGCGTNLCNSL
ncbi:UBN2_2 domain-containing protein, partial [Cephalotus follicularis]